MLKEKREYYLERADAFFCLWMIALALLYYMPFFLEPVDILLDISCVVGVGVIGYRFMTRKYQINVFTVLLAVFLACYAVTAVLHGCRLDEAKVGIYLLLAFFLFFSVTKEEQAFLTDKVMYLLVAFSLITGIASILLFLTGTSIISSNELTTGSAVVGIHPNGSLYGLIGNSNRMSWIAIFGICASLYCLDRKNWGKAKAVFYGNAALQVILIAFSNSRGGLMGLCVLAGVSTFGYVVKKHKQVLRAIGMMVLVLVLILGACRGVKMVEDVYYSRVIATAMEKAQAEIDAVNKKNIQKRPVQQRTERSSTQQQRTTAARMDAYRAGAEMFLDHPVLGIGKESVPEYIMEYLPEDSLLIAYETTGNLHSIYLTVLVCSGAVGFGILVVFMLLHMRLVIRNRKKLGVPEILLIALLLAILAINLFEAEILYNRTFSCMLFWYFMGVLSNTLRGLEDSAAENLSESEEMP